MRDPSLESGGGVRHADRGLLYATVSFTGASVMILELLGTRVIGPFYGASLYVWTSLISVAMIALAIGYGVGGFLADRVPRFRIAHAIALSALLVALIPPATTPILEATNALGLRGGAFTSALLLFLLPLIFLGMVGPLVIQRSTESLETVGIASGAVYAISTCGSVAGTLLFGFFLLPVVGSRTILYGLSAALFSVAIVLVVLDRRRGRKNSPHPFVFAGLLGLFATGFLGSRSGPPLQRVLYESESLYGRVRVIDDEEHSIRWLLSDSSTIGAKRIPSGHPIFAYLRVLRAVPDLRPEGTDALLIGLGGGFLSSDLERRGIVTDCIEIDPAVARAARKYFRFEPTGRLIVGDGRYEVRRLDRKYDFIFHDCFTGGSVPAHMLSLEMMEELRSLLREGGILALNFYGFARAENARAASSVAKTIAAVFPQVQVVTSIRGCELCDVIFLASDAPFDLASVGSAGDGYPPGWLADHAVDLSEGGGFVITDDFNPLENMQTKKAEAYRATLVERVGLEMLGT